MIRTLGIVTARGGSKGIPNKNLVELCGKPLLAYTAEVAKASGLTRIVLSTDCQEIASAGESFGLEVPFLRPEHLAQDDTPTIPVLQDVVTKLEMEEAPFDAVFTLQPTNPLRITSDIDGAIVLLNSSQADSVISFVDVGERHPARMKYIDPLGRVMDPPFSEQFEGQRRQELETLYLRDGSVYLTRRDVLMNQSTLKGDDCRAWLMPPQRSCNIDVPFDLFMVQHMLSQDLGCFPGRPASPNSSQNFDSPGT